MSCLSSGAFPIISKDDCRKAIAGLGLHIEDGVQTSHEDLKQEGCYLQGSHVFLPHPAVMAEPAANVPGDKQPRSNVSGKVRPICYMPVTEGPVDFDTDYDGLDLETLAGIPTPQICNEKCKAVELCFAWTWTSTAALTEAPYQCNLKYYMPQAKDRSANSRGLVSGMPGKRPAWGLLFCFAVMLSEGYEVELVKMQSEMGLGIFACDTHSIYSSRAVVIAPGEAATAVEGDFKCGIGGVQYSCLNTGTFIEVWKQIMRESMYTNYDWTVKVDPDTVFMADRLRSRLGTGYMRSIGMAYLNNCEQGLQGAIEVYSRGAMQAFAVLGPVCYSGKHKLDYREWGEALFMDQCLGKVLQVPRLEIYHLLNEDHCGTKKWQECSDSSVSYHPFKDPDAFRVCAQTASRHGEDFGGPDSMYSTIQT